ncbi:hypothetical protein WJX72_010583 [[Myrmecia] bisecta]|uniref:Uncharacterized protein n=1 Tax=[Myrmecia] bisecta TaxID=41462 RepID=A0AAW1R8B8_9CHLO
MASPFTIPATHRSAVSLPRHSRPVCSAQLAPTRGVRLAGRQQQRTPLRSSFKGTQIVQLRAVRAHAVSRRALVTEANLFSRLVRVVRSYANSLVSGAEDPEKMLDQTVNEMQTDLIRMRQASAQVVASQKQIEAKYKQAAQTADEWYQRAELALRKGDEELAKEALKRRKSYQDNANTMKVQLDAQRKAVDQLIGNTRVLESKLAEAKSKKDTLKARAKSAATSKQISEMIQGLNTSNAVVAFERMEEKVMALEAESEATLQLGTNDGLEAKFAALEGSDVDKDLADLKRGMLGGSRGSQSLPAGRSEAAQGRPAIKDAIDWELEELRRKANE